MVYPVVLLDSACCFTGFCLLLSTVCGRGPSDTCRELQDRERGTVYRSREWQDKGNGFMLTERSFRVGITKKSLPVRVVRPCQEAVAAPFLEVSKARLDRAQNTLGQWKVSLPMAWIPWICFVSHAKAWGRCWRQGFHGCLMLFLVLFWWDGWWWSWGSWCCSMFDTQSAGSETEQNHMFYGKENPPGRSSQSSWLICRACMHAMDPGGRGAASFMLFHLKRNTCSW